jgi:hypothetical protein
VRAARIKNLKLHSARSQVTSLKLPTLLVLFAISASTLSLPSVYGAETLTYKNPGTSNNLESLIGTFPQTLENERERADASDLYRAPGEPIINEWFKVDGVQRGFFSISSFAKFSLMPSFLFSKQSSKPEDLSNVISYLANLPPCFGVSQTDCIYDFSLITEDERVLKASPFATLPQVTDYPNVLWTYDIYGGGDGPFRTFSGDKSLNLPSGGDLWIWNVPDLVPGKNSLYSASVSLTGNRNPLLKKIFPNPQTKLQISPVEVDLPICRLPREGNGCTWRDYQTGLDGAIFDSDQISIKRSANNFTGKYKLGFRLSVPWTSWLISTVSGVDIQASRQGANYVYEVSGNPSSIPTIRKFFPINENYWSALGNFVDNNQCPTRAADCSPLISLGKFNINDQTFQTLEAAEKLTDSKASYMTKTWAIMSSSLASYNNPKDAKTELQICSERNATDRPAGITGSNATIFQHSPPTWDKNSRTFSYQVGSFKETPEGAKFLGDYSLLVSTDVARCLWGVDVGSAKATLEVLSSAGDKQVAITLVTSNPKWFRFRASGFHFSSPRIVASILKDSPGKTGTITCIKGKLTKKVTAVKPKCPVGYKKK